MASLAVCVVTAVAAMLVTPAAAMLVLVLPIVSFAGAGLSLLGLREIRRSGGVLGGRPIALVGLFVGLSGGILQGAAALSALGSAIAVRQNLAPVVEAFMLAGARQDRTATRAALGEMVSRHLGDERLDWFFAQLDERLGAPTGAGFGLGVMIRAANEMSRATAGVPAGKTVIENPKPMELRFARGSVIAYIIPDDDTMRAQQRVALSDILVMLPDGRTLPLRAEGPAAALAKRLGWSTVSEAPPP